MDYEEGKVEDFPEKIRLRCVLKEGELFVIPAERQEGPTEQMFRRADLPSKCRESVPIPIFYKNRIYGFVVTQLTHDIMNGGNFLADQIGRFLYTAEQQSAT